ncbi:hypothetical protein GCM10009841_18150 [Microlunatus panaciterrae]|uniref:Serine/threonine protein kinase n=1 Tax=Microlunatus panaciterrae TaxID=400768 RepID=A0ABS2RR15_9ACTN|nr:hypothetical protein [Microlunatus panaciterrae]MBM7800374.1 hypothetical protein [Microlunatus panaciterrae]
MAENNHFPGLEELAHEGERYATPLPAERVRELGTRRRRRRHAVALAAALAAVILTGGAVVTGNGLFTTLPPPVAHTPKPQRTAAPVPLVSATNLPTEADLEWHQPGDFKVSETYSGAGQDVASSCFLANPESFGPVAIFRRDYVLSGSTKGNFASAVTMQFDTAAQAEAVVKTMTGWADDCARTLTRQGHHKAGHGDWYDVDAGAGQAKFIEVYADVLGAPGSSPLSFDYYGLVRVDERVTFVSMLTSGQDSHWSYDKGSAKLPLQPMFRSLPKVAERLAGTRATDRPSPKTRTLSSRNLIPAADLPPRPAYRIASSRQMPAGVGRSLDQLSVCQRAGLEVLGASSRLGRNYREVPPTKPAADYPLRDLPNIYTLVLQFPDEATARKAFRTYTGWVDSCPGALAQAGFQVRETQNGKPSRPEWYPVTVENGSAKFTEIVYKRPAETTRDAGYFEGIGMTVVGDRMMIGVYLWYGTEHYWAVDPTNDPSGGGPHPLARILPLAATALGRG